MKLSMQAKIGMVMFTAVVLLGAMITWKGDLFLVSRGYELIGNFNNAGGLMPGSEVRYRGFKVGKVFRIDPTPGDVKVFLIIHSGINVPEGSSLRVAFDGLIGQKYVEIMPGLSLDMLKKGSTLPGISTLGIVDFIDIGTQNLEESKKILASIRKVTDDPQTQKAVRDILINIDKAAYEINRVSSSLGKSLGKGGFEDTIKNLSVASQNISTLSKKLDSIVGALDMLANDPDFTSDIKATAKNAKDAFEEFKKASQDASKALKRYSK